MAQDDLKAKFIVFVMIFGAPIILAALLIYVIFMSDVKPVGKALSLIFVSAIIIAVWLAWRKK